MSVLDRLAGIDSIKLSGHDDRIPSVSLDNLLILVYSMPEVNKPMTETTSRDLFPGALEMMILESLRRQPSHGYALGAAHPAAIEEPTAGGRGFALSGAAEAAESKAGEGAVGSLLYQPAGENLPDYDCRSAPTGASRFPVLNECLKALHWS